MKYISLYKKYFMKEYNATQEYLDLFSSPSTIPFEITLEKYPFFVNINNEITQLIEEIHTLNAKIIKMTYGNRKLPALVVNWLVDHTLIEEIQMSNEIEGVVSTRAEIKELLECTSPKKYKRLYGLVSKYQQLLESDIEVRTCKEVRELYDKTMLQDITKENKRNIPDGFIFRKEAVEVDSGGMMIHMGLNPEFNIIDTMDKALMILNDPNISLLVRVAIYHYLFGYIHPFYDGNGRMSRLISSAYLCKELDVITALQVSVSCKLHYKQYCDSFKIVNDIRNKGDLTYFVISFLEIFKKGLEHLIDSIQDKIDQYIYYEQCIHELQITDKHSLSLLTILLQCTLFTAQELTVEDLIKISKLSKATIKKKLSSSCIAPYIHIDRTAKTYRYSIYVDKLNK
ncbi:MAG: Fic family protein [Erysipelotrichaceae bacterium]|nr:Fic family protein [Erysipelotrichaceae bacterium]